MACVKLSSMPKPRTVRTFRFPALNGGLNIRDAEINLKDNESPEMVNLWWEDGTLQSRPGQEIVTSGYGAGSYSGRRFPSSDVVYASATFQEGVLVHIGSSIYTWHGTHRELRLVTKADGAPTNTEYSVPRNAGMFFRFGKDTYYKNVGGFFKLTYNSAHDSLANPFTISRVADSAFVPTILINADPSNGSGDLYQPENALSPQKRVTYNATTKQETVERTGDGISRFFSLDKTKAEHHLQGVASVYVSDGYIEPALYDVDVDSGTVLFHITPPRNAPITFTLDIGERTYKLPVTLKNSTDDVVSVTVISAADASAGNYSLVLTRGTDYTVDKANGTVTFTEAPPVTDPPTNNTVEIVYSKANTAAMNNVLNCPYAAVYGTGNELCAIVGGAEAAPNTFYWSGTTQYGNDVSYWPILNSNVADSPVTGFGRQYDQMFVFQRDRIGKLSAGVESVNGRDTVSLAYSGVNDTVGCDIPRSIQLVDNNLTFANTSGGVYRILSASAAYENNVQCVSDKINGSTDRPALLNDLRVTGGAPVCSLDDGKRYWLAVNGHVWLWDYSISTASDPVWFFFDGISPRALSMRDGKPCFVNAARETVRLGPTFRDFGGPIRKAYQFPVRNFGSYDRLKDVLTLIVSARADTPSDVTAVYETDYETRSDLIPLHVGGYDRLTDRNLEVRDLSVPRHAAVFRRAPGCKHVRHFSLRLENNVAGQNLAPYSVEIQYRFVGRDK